MTTELALLQPDQLTTLERTGKLLAASGYFDAKGSLETQMAQMAVKILAGSELGFGAFASANGIHIINGKPTVSANLMATAVRASRRYDYRVKTLTATECEIEFFALDNSKRESLGVSRFDTTDADKAGLVNKPIWKQYPKNLLFARAMSNGVRFFVPDVFGGNAVYVAEELGAEIDSEGEIINGSARIVEPTTGEILSQQPTANRQPPLTPYAAIAAEATGKLKEFLDWCYDLHRENGPCSDEQYRYLVGVINALTGVNASHHAVLAALVRRPVSSEDVPGKKLVSKLLDTLVEHKTVDEIKIANPTYKKPYASAIKRIYTLCLEIDGQARLLEDTDELLHESAQGPSGRPGLAQPLAF